MTEKKKTQGAIYKGTHPASTPTPLPSPTPTPMHTWLGEEVA